MALYKLLSFITFSVLTPLIVNLSGTINYYNDYVISAFEDDISTQIFDFIVAAYIMVLGAPILSVGSGSSGAVVATRLSKNYKVLLLEAGGDPSFLNSVPGLAPELLSYSQTDWGYKSEPQKYSCKGLKNQQASGIRGKVLGGTSTLNYMLYLRGHPNDYDNWANVTGDAEWKYENVLPFFKKSIADYKGKFQENDKHYGSSPYGFLKIEPLKLTPLKEEFLNAGKEMGYKEIDVNGHQTSGFGECVVTTANGVRGGTYATLLQNPRNPHNLIILKFSQAIKININNAGRAVGVWYFRHGKKKYATASKEVISSAGTLDSSKLLMLSGIGPKVHLEKLGIKLKVDLPVGQNLQDHIGTTVLPILIGKSLSFMVERDVTAWAFVEYVLHGTGPLAAGAMVNSQAFLSSSFVNNTLFGDWPDLQFLFVPIAFTSGACNTFEKSANYRKGFIQGVIGPNDLKDGVQVAVSLGRPRSRGEVTLKDKSPFSDPIIDPRYLEHPDDVKTMIEGIKFVLKMVENTKSFEKIGAEFKKVPMPGCKHLKYRSDAYWDCYVRHNSFSTFHLASTCRMGKNVSDTQAVVDSRLRVLGVAGLRVIDASIMPDIVNGNTNGPAMMIGEKGAHFVLDYWASQYLVSDRRQRLMYLDSYKCYYSRLV